jgi:hypothetical protein
MVLQVVRNTKRFQCLKIQVMEQLLAIIQQQLGVALFFGVVALVLGIVSAFVKGKAVIALVAVELAMICLTYVIISFGVFELKTDVNDLDGWYYYTNDDPTNDFFARFQLW